MDQDRLTVLIAAPRGFCAGVERAIQIVERAIEMHGAPVYVRHEIVHNRHVVESLAARGAVFVREVDEIPEGAVAIFSAHGVSREVEGRADLRRLDVIDATCPLVTKVHVQGRRFAEQGFDVVLIGHVGHPEVEGTVGQIPGRVQVIADEAEIDRLEIRDPARVAYVTQTTLSVSDTVATIQALKRRFPAIQGPDTRDICFATQNRQAAVSQIAPDIDLLLVVGAKNSSNSNRLAELGRQHGVRAHLIDDARSLDPAWLEGVSTMGLTAGASAPEVLVQGVLARLRELRDVHAREVSAVPEDVVFRLPARLDPHRPKVIPQDA